MHAKAQRPSRVLIAVQWKHCVKADSFSHREICTSRSLIQRRSVHPIRALNYRWARASVRSCAVRFSCLPDLNSPIGRFDFFGLTRLILIFLGILSRFKKGLISRSFPCRSLARVFLQIANPYGFRQGIHKSRESLRTTDNKNSVFSGRRRVFDISIWVEFYR
jgi:hypothetical protein